eukprot:scpid105844/ scgid13587/ 
MILHVSVKLFQGCTNGHFFGHVREIFESLVNRRSPVHGKSSILSIEYAHTQQKRECGVNGMVSEGCSSHICSVVTMYHRPPHSHHSVAYFVDAVPMMAICWCGDWTMLYIQELRACPPFITSKGTDHHCHAI